MSKEKAKQLGVKPIMRLVNICGEGCDPKYMGIGPAYAIPKCLKQAGLKFEDIEYWEINEAFAAQWLGVGRLLKKEYGMELSLDKVNHNGSGIAWDTPWDARGFGSSYPCTTNWSAAASIWEGPRCAWAAVPPWHRSGQGTSSGRFRTESIRTYSISLSSFHGENLGSSRFFTVREEHRTCKEDSKE